jgi:FkbM family methyltransferase
MVNYPCGIRAEIVGDDDDFGLIGAIERSKGDYEPHVMSLISTILQQGDICIDVGANIGVHTILMARLAESGRVIAFEPASRNVQLLRRNLEANDVRNVSVVEAAVYDASEPLVLHTDSGHPAGSHLGSRGNSGESSETVDGVRLDDWLSPAGLARIDFMKIDVEGAELRALSGALDTISRHKPDLVIECNPIALGRFQNATAHDLLSVLARLYQRVYALLPGGVILVEKEAAFDRLLEQYGLLDLACGPRVERAASSPPRQRLFQRLRRSTARIVRHRTDSQPRQGFIQDPSYEIHFPINRLELSPFENIWVPIRLVNRSDMIYSSSFPNHPITLSYRWRRASDRAMVEPNGVRTFLPAPLHPGAEMEVKMLIVGPAEVGEYELEAALVQEAFAWLDDIRPELRVAVDVLVR